MHGAMAEQSAGNDRYANVNAHVANDNEERPDRQYKPIS
jgi:hypothetical protein